MSPEKKIDCAFRALELLMPKVQNLPSTPEESKNNAMSALEELKAAEEYGINRNAGNPATQFGSNRTDVAGGPT